MSHAVLANGLRMYYESHGTGNAVVLIHGLGGTHDLWRYQVPALAERYRVITLDVRGHGQSDKPAGPYSIEMFADDVRQLLDELGVERAVMGGLSMGGGIVQTFALAYPQRVSALVLVSTSSEFTPETREQFHRKAEIVEREGFASILDTLVARRFTQEWLEQHPEEREMSAQSTLANDRHAYAASSRANSTRNLTGELHKITCPVLFVGGEEDQANPIRNAEIYRRHLPQVEIHLLPRLSHLLPRQAPERFNPILLEFLDRVHAALKEAQATT